MSYVDAVGPDRARDYARKLFELRVRGWGDETAAIDDAASWSKMSPRSFKRLMAGETKEPGESVFLRVRSAYLAYCGRLVARLQNEIEIEKRKHGDAHFEDLGAEAAALAEKVQAALERNIP